MEDTKRLVGLTRDAVDIGNGLVGDVGRVPCGLRGARASRLWRRPLWQCSLAA